MRHVSIKSIEAAIEKIDNLDDEAMEKLSETYALAQPSLLGYVMSAAIEYDNPNLEGLLIYYYCLITESFQQERISINIIEEEAIDSFQEPFFEALDHYFDKEDQESFEDFCDQPDLINFMAMEVSTPDEDGTQLDDETASQLFIVCSALITLLGRSQKELEKTN